MRLFIGLDIPEKIKSSLAQLQESLKNNGVKGHWKRTENMHLTLEFLGELEPSTTPVLSEIINKVANQHHSFKLSIENLGAFPSFTRPHTLWVGSGKGVDKLIDLQQLLHSELLSAGFKLDARSYKPHFTIASKPQIFGIDLSSYKDVNIGCFSVNELILYESKVEQGKRVYNALYKEKLISAD